ncbi:penicillin-binding transpeptidase domain-containing protein [Phycicoccus sp. M110.8]|uniref:peptidoglycan D,D-transpeptidase FtsI family protein n=1 Tax=Phycicoccus sp. M110.8 TaxID=3075433 RepID=UPI0028FDB2AB|nr:penicillin-binding transpeptidase domain-containing protein [Phycicoccus sp. M110.8]MDU0313733.1 penicillin-binding transpeptidase domain-containing protein [Phycicoccus sp. M110.8]HET8768588.1 penicillin-binding transpeptidase domain-containing protein [Pedococcus sp.]
MNAPIRRLSTVVALLFSALLVSTTLIQFVQAKSLNERPDNRRTLLATYARERGQILVGGAPIAKSVPSKDELKWLRTYPRKDLYAHVTGYYSFTYGAGGGIEGAEDSLLSGASDKLFYRRVSDILTGKEQTGASLELTLDAKAQAAADKALGKQRGAVVALNPKTGEVLALVSHPSYDPSVLSSHDTAKVVAAWKQLNGDPDRPMVDRAIAGNLYPPGSTFKVVTTAAALESGKFTEESQIPGPATLDLPQTTVNLPNDDRRPCGPNNKTSLTHALEISCNTAYGWLGMQVGADAFRAQAAKFGIGDRLSIPMSVTPSSVPAQLNEPQLAQSAIGQYDVRVTPLQMAMVAAAIANKGIVMKPYLVSKVTSSDLETIDEAQPEQLSQAVSANTAAALTRMMQTVVKSGTGTAAQISGVDVAGKTGTAQHATGAAPHAWFISFAPAEDPKVAVAVVVEDGGNAGSEAFGGRVAAPIAKAVMEAVLGK